MIIFLSGNYFFECAIFQRNLSEVDHTCCLKWTTQFFHIKTKTASFYVIIYTLKCSFSNWARFQSAVTTILGLTSLNYVNWLEFTEKIGVDYPFSWNEENMTGRTWYYFFMKRQKQLILRTPEQTSFCKVNVKLFLKISILI